MGAWGTSLYSDDFACDIRDDYVEKLRRGKTNEEATQEMIDENQSSVENTEDEATFWLALADTQWNYGRLLPDVKEKAMLFVNQDTMAECWSECGQHTERLKVPHELGRKPYKIECTGEFELHEMHYYVFKFKTCALSPWRVGVSGGYEGDSLEPCGHTFSKMRRYDAATAQNDCIEMVEMIRAFWIEQAKRLAQQQ